MNINRLISLFKETYRGKTIARTFFNWEISEHVKNVGGVILDLGGGKSPSYERFWHIKPDKFIRVDVDEKTKPDIVADLNKPLPFPNDYADTAFIFSVIYILKNPADVLKEVNRVLKPGGKLFLTSPFIFNEAKEPNDYLRFTSEGLEKLLKESGFNDYFIIPVGERFSAAAYIITPLFVFWPIKFIFYFTAIMLDRFIPKKLKLKQPCPIGYFIEAHKI